MKLNHILTEVDRAAVRKGSKRTMGLSVPHNRHAKRQQSKAARQYDIDTEDYAKESPERMGDEPYAVGYAAQGHEWRGDEPYEDEGSRGRWKQYDDGMVVAINVPDYETAEKIMLQWDKSYEDGSFKDKVVYSKPKDEYYTEYYGAWIKPMKETDAWEYKYTDPVDHGANNESKPTT